jgi:hypothetical protein
MRSSSLLSVSLLILATACTSAAAPATTPTSTATATATAASSAPPTAAPTAPRANTPTPTVAPSPTPHPSDTGSTQLALTQAFTSAIHGISVSYPGGWHLQPATETWDGDVVLQNSAFADVIYEKADDTPFIALASQLLGGQSFDDWSNAYMAKLIDDDASCAATESITVDGAAGVLSVGCFIALVSDGDRGYLIWLYRVHDRQWFDQILATVQLLPDEAVD